MVSPHRSMKAELIIPIDALRGKLREDGYYFRMYKGVQIVQRCPDRSKHKKTVGELENQERFARRAQVVNQMLKAGSRVSRKNLWKLAAQAV